MPLSHETAVRTGKMGGRKLGAFGALRKLENAKRKVMDKLIFKKTAPLIRAGISSALGQNFVYRIDEERDSKGKLISRKHVLVTDEKEIAIALDKMEEGGRDPEDSYYYVTTKEPDVRAIEMLLNRAYGKPKESITVDGKVEFSLIALAERAKQIEAEMKKPTVEVLPVDDKKNE